MTEHYYSEKPGVAHDEREVIYQALGMRFACVTDAGVFSRDGLDMDPDVINKAIDDAVEEAKRLGIHGKQTTPFLLAKIKDITGGDSLASNIRLVYNNAELAAKIAENLAK